ncbi:muscarinic acetylcholine receptor M1 [Halichoeres trimaculatus]|uniref:muscarinic acetylcholine receptor M1 n=1 Tax=Halichoeres trimaculatus TaxID=147232 RepID=UPI003D9EB333
MNPTPSSDSVVILTGSSSTDVLYGELTVLLDSPGGWERHNVSNVSGNDSAANRMLSQKEDKFDPLGGHTVWQVIIIVFLTGSLSLVTVVGNILVLVSFKINKALKTVNNYYLLSLAFADLTIGTLSMNLYTTYLIMDQWALGPVVCDLWLAIDYVASNASVMNLLVISFDRYFSVTRPLTYRAKRTTKRAMTMICLAWSISFILWAPAILFWQYIVGERTVLPNECYIQFLSEPIITFCTAIAAFYLPVTIMATLFWKIFQETEKRAKEVQGLKGSGAGKAPGQSQTQGDDNIHGGGDGVTNSQKDSSAMQRQMSSQSSSSYELNQMKDKVSIPGRGGGGGICSAFCFKCSSLLPSQYTSKRSTNTTTSTAGEAEPSSCDSLNNNEEENEGVDGATDTKSKKKNKDKQAPSIKSVKGSQPESVTSSPADQSAAMAKRFASKAKMEINKKKNEKKVNEKKANDKKAARTLSAILFAFITTWLPYNIMVLVNTFCQDCIPGTLWALGYWLCYVNSTVNPMCYALCNKTFRTTFRDILMCRWNQKKKPQFQQRKNVAFKN